MSAARTEQIRLTQLARSGGCAAKLRLGELVKVLGAMVPDAAGDSDAARDILVDQEYADDAAVVGHPAGRALVLTADVIAPLVDDPETFGEIAATNAMSDVWAMGGEPRFALNLVFFPDDQLPLDVLHAVLRGGARACARAGVAVVGGHSVRDPEVKYGLSVTGEVDPGAVLSNRGGSSGQALVLTKALGTGVVSTAIKQEAASPEEIAAAVASMTTLNRTALHIARRFGVTACTDVTGFGLFGHLRNVLRGSGLAATVDLAALPLLPGALRHAATGLIPGGSRANRAFLAPQIRWADGAGVRATPEGGDDRDLLLSLACDAQTSGGLLLCVPADRGDAVVVELRRTGLEAARIGALRSVDDGEEIGAVRLA